MKMSKPTQNLQTSWLCSFNQTCNKIYSVWKRVGMSRYPREWRKTPQCKFFCTT